MLASGKETERGADALENKSSAWRSRPNGFVHACQSPLAKARRPAEPAHDWDTLSTSRLEMMGQTRRTVGRSVAWMDGW